MKFLESSGVDGLYVEFEENMEEDYDGYENYYTNVNIYGDKKYAQDKLDKRKIEIELEVEAGEKASEVFEAAKKWVEKRIAVEKLSDYTIEKGRKVMDDKRNHTLAQIEEAEEILAKVKISDDELPF